MLFMRALISTPCLLVPASKNLPRPLPQHTRRVELVLQDSRAFTKLSSQWFYSHSPCRQVGIRCPVRTCTLATADLSSSPVSYSGVQELDSDGRLREVIEDAPPPPPTISPSTTHNAAYSASFQSPIYSPPICTRARAAAEAQALSASSPSVLTAPAPKKRKRDLYDKVRAPTAKKPAASSQQSHTVVGPSSTDSRSGPAPEDVGLFHALSVPYFTLSFHIEIECPAMTKRAIILSCLMI